MVCAFQLIQNCVERKRFILSLDTEYKSNTNSEVALPMKTFDMLLLCATAMPLGVIPTFRRTWHSHNRGQIVINREA